MEAIFAAVAFAALFAMWVVLPSRLRKSSEQRAKVEHKDAP